MRTQRGLDLAGLDTEAPNLDLLVGAAEIVDFAVGLALREIAGAIASRARRAVRIGNEARGGQAGPVQVAARDARAADVNLAGDAVRR
ncbi:hypothetical protein WT02_16590, partial [Burkholderia stagnalis]